MENVSANFILVYPEKVPITNVMFLCLKKFDRNLSVILKQKTSIFYKDKKKHF